MKRSGSCIRKSGVQLDLKRYWGAVLEEVEVGAVLEKIGAALKEIEAALKEIGGSRIRKSGSCIKIGKSQIRRDEKELYQYKLEELYSR